MKTLPLFYYPSTWLYIDDDKTLLKSMMFVFQEHNYTKLFQSPLSCVDFLNTYQSPLSKHIFLKSITDDENYGVLQHTPINFDITMIAKLANDPHRHNEVTAMIIDYNMPEMDGFELAQNCNHLPIQKLLLTGKAKPEQGIVGFNNNLIHRFIKKNEIEWEEKLIANLKELTLQFFREKTTSLLSYLETENKLPLSDKIFIDFFEKYCEQHNIREYYLINKQGSFLCLDNKGHRSYFVLQTDQGIDTWLASHSADKELPKEKLDLVRERKKIPFFGQGKEAWQIDPSEWPKYLYTPNVLDGRERYFWTKINL